MSAHLIEARSIVKTFAGNRALDDVSLTVDAGEIVALLGHNGSGKSTLVKVLSGIYAPDSGSLEFGSTERPTKLHVIHQDLGLIPQLSVIENLALGRRNRAGGLLPFRHRQEVSEATALIRRFGLDVDPAARIADLSPAQRAIVAIARAFEGWSAGDNVLILDEPTAALHGEEVGLLHDAVRAAAKHGAGIVYISHRLGEVVDLADRVVVLKDGREVAALKRGEFEHRDLVRAIVGGEHEIGTARTDVVDGTAPIAIQLTGLVGGSITGLDLVARRGEILGIAGLVGSGMEVLNSLIFGAVQHDRGVIEISGSAEQSHGVRAAIKRGIAFVPADRRGLGSIGRMTARENLTLPRLADLRRLTGNIRRGLEQRVARDWMERVGVVPAGSEEQVFDRFSGGNQQKIVLAKWLS